MNAIPSVSGMHPVTEVGAGNDLHAFDRAPMAAGLGGLLESLREEGERHDASTSERKAKRLNITPATGVFLHALVSALRPRRILELGTSNAYSTLWLASAAQTVGARVVTSELSADKVAQARENLRRADLNGVVELEHADAADVLSRTPRDWIDLLFLDADRSQYERCWPEIDRVLRPGGVLIVDNAVSHAAEVQALVRRIHASAGWTCSLVPVGKGELIAVKPWR